MYSQDCTHVVVGGGSAGCVLASRLSEDDRNNVVLLEAGRNIEPSKVPSDISDTYAGSALMNGSYFWPDLRIRRNGGSTPEYFEQARVLGGGSSINGQVALRGAPQDYDSWHTAGAVGWDWNSVLPYFRKLETDLDFVDQLHGSVGPIAVRRIPLHQWDDFTLAVTRAWERRGHRMNPDMNGEFGEGYSPLPLSNDATKRSSAATGYLTSQVRSRPNLRIHTHCHATRLLFREGKVNGVEYSRDGELHGVYASVVVVCCGSLHSPTLLMRSGIGPGSHLNVHGIEVVRDLPGVGQNLMDHPAVHISGYLKPIARSKAVLRRNYTYLRYSSNMCDVGSADMVMMAVCRSAWHAVGSRIGTLSAYVGKSFSRGTVALKSRDAFSEPDVNFNWLSDERDFHRLDDGFLRMAEILRDASLPRYISNIFPATFSDKVRSIGQVNLKNRILTDFAAVLMDVSSMTRQFVIDQILDQRYTVHGLVEDADLRSQYIRENVGSVYHPTSTCRMGAENDPMAVVSSTAKVIGLDNLYVADASIMPCVTTTNTNIPVIMIAEKVSDHIRQVA